MARHVVIDTASVVVNIIEIGDLSLWTPPAGCSLIRSPLCLGANIGDLWTGGAFISNAIPQLVDPLEADKQRVIAFMRDAQVSTLIQSDPALLTPAQQVAQKQAVAFRSLVRVVRAELS